MLGGGGFPTYSYSAAWLGDTIKPYVGSSLLYDSNYLRLSDRADTNQFAGGNSDKSEFIKQVKAGFDMDWRVSRQHILVKANVNQNWYQNFTNLDYTGWDTLAQWDWQIRSKFTGEIGYSNNEVMGSFAQLNALIPNLQNNQKSFINAGYLFHPNARFKLGVFRTERRYDAISRQISNNTEDNAEFGLQYLSPTGSTLGLELLATDGHYPQRQITSGSTQDNAYNRMRYSVNWDWHVNPKTRVDGLVGYVEQHYKHFSVRDFADAIAEMNLRWYASDKTSLMVSARRQIYQFDNLFSSFLLTQGVWFNLAWQATPKINLTLPASYQQQQYLGGTGTGTNNAGIFQQQKDNVYNIGLKLMYQPLDTISIGPVLMYEKRDSNNPLSSYTTLSAGINLQVTF